MFLQYMILSMIFRITNLPARVRLAIYFKTINVSAFYTNPPSTSNVSAVA